MSINQEQDLLNRNAELEKELAAKNRELEIEASLERVRAKSMAMHHSDDLISVINIVQEQLLALGFHFHAANFVTDYSEKGYAMWLASPGESFPFKIYVPQSGLKYFEAVNTAIERGSDFATYTLNFEEKNIYFRNFFENSLAKNTSEEGKRIVYESKGMAASVVLLDKVRLNLMNLDLIPFTEEENTILKRFGYVFEQSYTRFLDLQKAEAQAREALIETGLERVRSKTMAMYKSEEVTGVAVSLNEELLKLGFNGGSTIIIIDRETGDTEQWTGFSEDKSLKSCYVPYFKHPCHDALLDAWKKGEKFLVYTLAGDEKRSFDEHYFTTGYKDFPESDKRWMRQMESVTFSYAFMKYGAIHWGPDHLTEEQLRILQRFSKVFEQSYTRFLDLQKAEAQAREAQIEAALEKVRSRSLAMHQSSELEEVIMVVSEQLQQLQFRFHNVSFVRYNEKKGLNFWLASPGRQQPFLLEVPYLDNPVFNRPLEAFKNGVDFIADVLTPEENHEWLKHLIEHSGFKNFSDEDKKNLLNTTSYARSLVLMKHIILVIGNFAAVPYTEEQNFVLKRFANVFDQAYTRFLDLQKAEAQAREAQIELGLERVRARAMAMQRSDELAELVDIVFKELTKLHFTLDRCIIIIVDEKSRSANYWMANPESRTPTSYHLELKDIPYLIATFNAWKERKAKMVYDLKEDEKSSTVEYIFGKTEFQLLPDEVKQGMKNTDRIFLNSSFNNFGGLQADTIEPLSEDNLDILYRFSKVFDLTYTRFSDLKLAEQMAHQAELDLIKLKEEKKRTEDALSELQATQKQLIQSEKMASLGELTAGIAHEIQNPLNFVNNFSDVSNELLDEMKQELATGNTQQAIAIVNDVKENLEKILHHGKRADGIVKSMLQHSRSSTGKKEPTDINGLAEEYLRLAYHGLRAKDKFFNAKFETDLDNTIGKINIISQDVGRVILNLINNAFYAVSEKKKNAGNGYEPIVTLSTKNVKSPIGGLGVVEISVKDNGDGIPQKVLDKIFQPFFTTKPTGQGTGLGLSLSYDIITKGHDGKLLVRTREGEGSEFIISLPVN